MEDKRRIKIHEVSKQKRLACREQSLPFVREAHPVVNAHTRTLSFFRWATFHHRINRMNELLFIREKQHFKSIILGAMAEPCRHSFQLWKHPADVSFTWMYHSTHPVITGHYQNKFEIFDALKNRPRTLNEPVVTKSTKTVRLVRRCRCVTSTKWPPLNRWSNETTLATATRWSCFIFVSFSSLCRNWND